MNNTKITIVSIITVGLLFVFTSCQEKDGMVFHQEGSIPVLRIDVQKSHDILANDIFQEYKVVELITPDQFYLGRIDKIINQDNKLYALDKELSSRINSYDFSGNFLNSFSFSELPYSPVGIVSDFDVLKSNGHVRVYFHDPTTKNFVTLTENLELEEIVKFPNSFMHFNVLEDHIFQFRNELAYNHEDSSLFYNYIITDHSGAMQFGSDPFSIPVGEKTRYSPREPLFKDGKRTFFIKWANDTIYTSNKDSIRPELYIDFGKKSIRHRTGINPLFLVDYTVKNPTAIATGITNLIYTDDFLYFQYIYDLAPHFVLFNRAINDLAIGDNLSLKHGDVVPYPMQYNQGYFISYIDDTQLSVKDYRIAGIDLVKELIINGKTYVIIFKH